MANQPDPALLQRFAQGDRQAFEALFRAFEHEVYRWILRIVRDKAIAEDGVVETFWRCYRSRARFDPTGSFGAWLRRIATHVAFDHLKTLQRYRSMHGTEPAVEPPDGSSEPARHSQADAIGRAFDALPPKLRIVATLALIEQCTLAEIGAALGVPLGTVKSRLSRATGKLRQALQEADEP